MTVLKSINKYKLYLHFFYQLIRVISQEANQPAEKWTFVSLLGLPLLIFFAEKIIYDVGAPFASIIILLFSVPLFFISLFLHPISFFFSLVPLLQFFKSSLVEEIHSSSLLLADGWLYTLCVILFMHVWMLSVLKCILIIMHDNVSF